MKKIKSFLNLVKNKDPYITKRILRQFRLVIYSLFFKFIPNKKGVNVLNKKWDYLIILDACRYDLFKKKQIIDGNLSKINSLGSSTVEWMINTFENTSNKDIIYITTNPHMTKRGIFKSSSIHLRNKKGPLNFRPCSFFKILELWKTHWDDATGTVQPKEVLRKTLETKKKYPHKKIIIHFLQPHDPYIGNTKLYDKIDVNNKTRTIGNLIQDEVRFGKITKDQLKDAYIDNLSLVLKYVKELISKLEGRTIISADHGEAFGEKGIYFHPTGIHIKELIEVPWLIINNEKKAITKNLIKKIKI